MIVRWFIALVTLLIAAIPACAELTYTPTDCIDLDLGWLSPPTVTPQDASGSAQVQNSTIQILGKTPGVSYSFTWPLRYPIDTPRYSVMVLQYRARGLTPSAEAGDALLTLQLRRGLDEVRALPALRLPHLIQDGALHELRCELFDAAGDSVIDALRFTFNASATGGELDLCEIRFERSPKTTSAAPLIAQQPIDLLVTDAQGNPMPDAEVRVGILERANWTTIGRTDSAGHAILNATVAPDPAGLRYQPLEAAAQKPGYLPQYLAPIDLPPAMPTRITLSLIPPPQPQTPAAIGQGPEGTIYAQPYTYVQSPIVYETPYVGPTYYVASYTSGWWIPPYYCERPRYRYDWNDRDRNHDNRRDHNDADRNWRHVDIERHRPEPTRPDGRDILPPPTRMRHWQPDQPSAQEPRRPDQPPSTVNPPRRITITPAPAPTPSPKAPAEPVRPPTPPRDHRRDNTPAEPPVTPTPPEKTTPKPSEPPTVRPPHVINPPAPANPAPPAKAPSPRPTPPAQADSPKPAEPPHHADSPKPSAPPANINPPENRPSRPTETPRPADPPRQSERPAEPPRHVDQPKPSAPPAANPTPPAAPAPSAPPARPSNPSRPSDPAQPTDRSVDGSPSPARGGSRR